MTRGKGSSVTQRRLLSVRQVARSRALRPALLAACLFLSTLALISVQTWAGPAHQANDAGPVELVGVAGGSGATLWDETSGDAVVELTPGDRVAVYERSDDGKWYFVETAQGLAGWASTDRILVVRDSRLPSQDVALSPVRPTPTPTESPATNSAAAITETETTTLTLTPTTATVVTEDERLNVRSGPGRGYDVIAKALPGERYAIVSQNRTGSWIEIALDDANVESGWVSAEFVTLGDDDGTPQGDSETPAKKSAKPASGSPSTMATSSPMAPQGSTNVGSAGLSGKLVFQDIGGQGIFIYEMASGRLYKLTNGIDPALSPDGRQVAFTRGGGENGIYLIDVDGGNERKIFGERELLRAPKWSPDGRWIVFSRGSELVDCYLISNGRCMSATWIKENMSGTDLGDLTKSKERHYQLARVDADGGNYGDLAVLPSATAPDWNSGGIVYQSKAGIQVTQDDPGATTELVYFDILKQYHNDPDWQSDGGRILFQQREASHWEIYAINPDGSGRVALTHPEFTLVEALPSNASPAWSPDGQHIVFISNREDDYEAGQWRLWVMSADGSNQRPLPVNTPMEYTFDSAQMVDWGP